MHIGKASCCYKHTEQCWIRLILHRWPVQCHKSWFLSVLPWNGCLSFFSMLPRRSWLNSIFPVICFLTIILVIMQTCFLCSTGHHLLPFPCKWYPLWLLQAFQDCVSFRTEKKTFGKTMATAACHRWAQSCGAKMPGSSCSLLSPLAITS